MTMRDPERLITPREKKPKRCPACGAAWPEYSVEDIKHVVLGCENCLVILKNGMIQ